MVLTGRQDPPDEGSRSSSNRIVSMLRPRTFVWCALVLAVVLVQDFRPDSVALAIAPYRFSVVGWELGNLPDKWIRRAVGVLRYSSDRSDAVGSAARAHQYFEIGKRIRSIERRLIGLEVNAPSDADSVNQIQKLRRERDDLRETQNALRPAVEETLESAVADTLHELGFRAWAGVFPPVDTALTGSPTVLVLSPRDRIQREDGSLLRTGLTNDERESIETRIEEATNLSALVENTGGIALYPSITADGFALEHALEIIAHEWVHQWLWFRPLGRRYFKSGDLTTLNETVATIAGIEISQLALERLTNAPDVQTPANQAQPASARNGSTNRSPQFDFQAEMRTTRVQVDALLEAGDIDGAEAYMEERRRVFVSEGYSIRKLNQAYFAFHGTYATTGAAGVSVIGEQVQELRRQSPSLAEFLRTAAQLTSAQELADYVERAKHR